MRFITERTALALMLFILTAVVIFHGLVLFEVIPFGMVWGGRLTTEDQMVQMEAVSIVVNLLMLLVTAARGGLLLTGISNRVIRIALWLMAALFLLNTFGNIASRSQLEQLVFTPITALLFLCSLRLVVGWRGTHGLS